MQFFWENLNILKKIAILRSISGEILAEICRKIPERVLAELYEEFFFSISEGIDRGNLDEIPDSIQRENLCGFPNETLEEFHPEIRVITRMKYPAKLLGELLV